MRISTSLAQQMGLNAILNQQAKQVKTQQQLGSGLRILTPSDDPAASARVLDIQQSIERTQQYQSNISTVQSRLTLEDSTLAHTITALQRVRELAVQGLNDTNTASDRSSIEQEVRQIVDELVGLANTQNANGEYLFSGYHSHTSPYAVTVTPVTQGGVTKDVYVYQYQGDENQRDLQVGATRRIADGDDGVSVFGRSFDYLGNPPTTLNPVNPTEGSIFDAVTKLANQLAVNDPDPLRVTTSGAGMGTVRAGAAINPALLATAVADQTITVTAPDSSTQTHIIDTDSERSAADIALNLNALSGVTAQANPNQVSLDVTGTAGIVDGDVVSFMLHADSGTNTPVSFIRDSASYPTLEADFAAAINGAGVGDLTAAVSGTNRLSISSASGANIGIEDFTVADAASAIQTIDFDNTTLTEGGAVDSAFKTSTVVIDLNDGYTIQSDIAGTAASGTFGIFDAAAGSAVASSSAILDDLDQSMQRILNVRASIGARLNALDLQHDLNEDFVLDMQSVLSDTQDLDYAEAISRFNLQLVGLQAAQQAFVRVQGLSLFNFL